MQKLNDLELGTLKLIKRSTKRDSGWCKCSDIVWKKFIQPLSDELVEKDAAQMRVRLTNKGRSLCLKT